MAKVTVAATQFACGADSPANIDKAEAPVRRARRADADIVLLQELFATPYSARTRRHRSSRPPSRQRATRCWRAWAGSLPSSR